MKLKQWQKDVFTCVGFLALDTLAHLVTAQNEIQTRRSVSVNGVSDQELVIERDGKKESLPLIIRNCNHLMVIIESLNSGKKIDLVLKCVVSKPHTKPTVLKAEILELQFAA